LTGIACLGRLILAASAAWGHGREVTLVRERGFRRASDHHEARHSIALQPSMVLPAPACRKRVSARHRYNKDGPAPNERPSIRYCVASTSAYSTSAWLSNSAAAADAAAAGRLHRFRQSPDQSSTRSARGWLFRGDMKRHVAPVLHVAMRSAYHPIGYCTISSATSAMKNLR